jgi:CubicO group peptidase (beta-lactamase class C family)
MKRTRSVPAAATILTVMLAPFISPAAAQVPAGFDPAWKSVSEAFRDRVTGEGIVGASLAFVVGGEIVAAEYVGLADRATRRAVDERTIYHWASITKTFTAIALMQLRDRGLVSLDDPVTRYVPEIRGAHNPFGSMDDITLRHLLTHTAGFRAATWPWGGEPWHPHEPTEWSQLVAMMPYTDVAFEPGSKFSYSNPGIVFIGRVIETVTGEPYEAYVEKNILRPLGMSTAYFDRTPYHLLPWRSNSYFSGPEGLRENGLDFDTGVTVMNGGLNASVPDMARYLGFLVGASGVDVLSRASLEEMWREAVPAGTEAGLAQGMGLGFFLLHDGARTFVGHTGSQMGFISFIHVDPETGTGAIGNFNTLGISPGPGTPPEPDTRGISADIRSLLFREVFPLFGPDGR